MALHNKADLLASLHPTVAVLPESGHPDHTRKALESIGATSIEWIGGNPHKGLSVVTFDGWRLRLDESYDPGYQWVMPVHVLGPIHIRLLAVWDMNHRGTGHDAALRLGACRASMDHYEAFLSGPADLALISGDFNNSVVWDRSSKRVRFGDFMDQLASRGFFSAYHHARRCPRGSEPEATLWWTRNADKPYHIDYTFVSRPEAVETVTVGTHTDWLAHSDHSPMTVDLRVTPLPGHGGTPKPTPGAAGRGGEPEEPGVIHRSTAASPVHRRPVSVSASRNLERFPLEPGSVPDMLCGVNGQGFVQSFRPTSFTAEWTGGVLTEVRIWGPRVLRDGSLGKRELDHRWKRPYAAGGVEIGDLPPLVADRLRSLPQIG